MKKAKSPSCVSLLIFGILIFFWNANGFAQTLIQRGEWVAPLNGAVRMSAAHETNVFLVIGGVIKILDATNPKNFKVQANIPLRPEEWSIMDLKISNELLYVASHEGLYVIDISNPQQPGVVKRVDLTGATKITISANRLYAARGSSGFQIFSLANPRAPFLIGSFSTTPCWDLAVTNGLVYAAAATGGLKVVDVTDPASPALIGGNTPADSPYCAFLEMRGNLVILAASNSLRIFDGSNPVNPPLVSTIWTYVNPRSLAVSGNLLGVSHSSGALFYDISDASNPVTLPPLATPDSASIKLDGQFLHVSSNRGGFRLHDVSDPRERVLLGTFETDSLPRHLYVYGAFAYALDLYNDFRIFDISEPNSPKHIWTYQFGVGEPPGLLAGRSVAVSAKKAFLGFDGGFDVVDMSDSTAIHRTARFRGKSPRSALAVINQYVYTSNGEIVNVSNPSSPMLAGTFAPLTNVTTFETEGTFIYYTAQESFGILDVSDPLMPKVATSVAMQQPKTALSWPYWYGWHTVYDVSAPYSIISNSIPLAFGHAAVSGQMLFTDFNTSLTLSDIRSPLAPVWVTSIGAPESTALAAKEPYLYHLSPTGLKVFEGALPPIPERPRLEIVDDGPNLILRWPTQFADFKLNATSSFDQPWELVTTNPYVVGDYFVYTNRFPFGLRFYKLIK